MSNSHMKCPTHVQLDISVRNERGGDRAGELLANQRMLVRSRISRQRAHELQPVRGRPFGQVQVFGKPAC